MAEERDNSNFDSARQQTILDSIKHESDRLRKIASIPLPDVSALIGNVANNAHTFSTGESEYSEEPSRWALGMTFILGDEDILDIRTLNPDPAKLLNDIDGDRSSLYWYVKSKRSTTPDFEFTTDPTFNSLADRVILGFSMQSQRMRAESHEDQQVTMLAVNMKRVLNASSSHSEIFRP